MCLGELGRVVDRRDDVAVVRTGRGTVLASVLLAPGVQPGDHVLLHSGQVLSVVGAEEADHAAALRAGTQPTRPEPPPHTTPTTGE